MHVTQRISFTRTVQYSEIIYALKMLFPILMAMFVALASSRPNTESLDVDPIKYCGCSKEPTIQCGCCLDFGEIVKENATVCTNLTYIEKEYGVRLTVTFNDDVLINETLSGKNPPPLCQGLIGVADICVKVFNISYDVDRFGGCLRIYGDLLTRVLDIELGCYYLPISNELNEITDKRARLHSLFEISNVPKDVIVEEMHKWSFEQDHREDAFPEEPLLQKSEEAELME